MVERSFKIINYQITWYHIFLKLNYADLKVIILTLKKIKEAFLPDYTG